MTNPLTFNPQKINGRTTLLKTPTHQYNLPYKTQKHNQQTPLLPTPQQQHIRQQHIQQQHIQQQGQCTPTEKQISANPQTQTEKHKKTQIKRLLHTTLTRINDISEAFTLSALSRHGKLLRELPKKDIPVNEIAKIKPLGENVKLLFNDTNENRITLDRINGSIFKIGSMEARFEYLKPNEIFCIHLPNKPKPKNITISDPKSGKQSKSVRRLGNTSWYSVSMIINKVPDVITFNNTIVKTFPYYPRTKICRKCTKPNHTLNTCKAREPTCAKCSGKHWTKDCELQKQAPRAQCEDKKQQSTSNISFAQMITNAPNPTTSASNINNNEELNTNSNNETKKINKNPPSRKENSSVLNAKGTVLNKNQESPVIEKIVELEITVRELKINNAILIKDKQDKDKKIQLLENQISDLSTTVAKLLEHSETLSKVTEYEPRITEHILPTKEMKNGTLKTKSKKETISKNVEKPLSNAAELNSQKSKQPLTGSNKKNNSQAKLEKQKSELVDIKSPISRKLSVNINKLSQAEPIATAGEITIGNNTNIDLAKPSISIRPKRMTRKNPKYSN